MKEARHLNGYMGNGSSRYTCNFKLDEVSGGNNIGAGANTVV